MSVPKSAPTSFARSLAFVFGLVLVLGATSVAQKAVACRPCKGKGALPCKVHKKQLAWEKNVLFCSEAGACEACGGAYQVDCKICRNEAVENSAVERRALVQKWFEDRRANVEKFTKSKKILHVKSKHFDLTFSFAPMPVGRKPRNRSQHELMHIWIDRLEAQYAKFCALLGLKDEDFEVRVQIYMFEKRVDHVLISPQKTGTNAGFASGTKAIGDKMVLSMWKLPREMRNDADVHRYMSHHVTHLFVNHMAPHTWLYNKNHGWIDAGLAHFFEHENAGHCTFYCNDELRLDPGVGWKGGFWRVAVRNLVDSKKATPFRDIYQLNVDQLSLQAHALSMAYVEFLIKTEGGEKLRDLIRAVKNNKPTREAMKQIYGLSPITIDDKFVKWVKKNYPKRVRRKRR